MKFFILKFSLFFLPFVAIAIILEVLIRNIPNDYTLKKEYLDEHSNEVETLILGSSHTYYGLDPVFFTTNCFNASHVSQTLDYDFEILKKYDEEWESLKTVILPISYFTLFDKLEIGVEHWRVKNYNIYYKIHTSNNLENNLEILNSRMQINFNKMKLFYLQGKTTLNCTQLGWGTNYNSSKGKNLIATGKEKALLHTKNDKQYLSENTKTLIQIIEYCNSINAHVILITPPAYDTYTSELNLEQLNQSIQTATKISKSKSNCKYFNLLNDTIYKAEDYYDADHLNEIGAKKFSLEMNLFVNKQ